jgi:hypothetical protein
MTAPGVWALPAALSVLPSKIADMIAMAAGPREGAASTITLLPDGYVRKTIKRSARKSTTRHPAPTQLAFHTTLYRTITPHSPFTTPAPRPSTESPVHSYEMEAIDTRTPLRTREEILASPLLAPSLQELETKVGFQLWDCEFYEQPTTGKIAIVDFDQVRRLG